MAEEETRFGRGRDQAFRTGGLKKTEKVEHVVYS